MPNLFSVKELISIAVREEGTGANFYRAAARSARSAELKDFMLRVAAMEDEHGQKFSELLERIGGYEPQGESYDGEYESYMAYMLQGRIFAAGQDGVELARRQASDRDAVETAMELERNSLLFYHELAQFVPEADRPLLEGIITEERQHVTDLARYKEAHF